MCIWRDQSNTEPESFNCFILKARLGLLLGVVHHRPLGAIRYLPPMNQGKAARPLFQTLCTGVTLVFLIHASLPLATIAISPCNVLRRLVQQPARSNNQGVRDIMTAGPAASSPSWSTRAPLEEILHKQGFSYVVSQRIQDFLLPARCWRLSTHRMSRHLTNSDCFQLGGLERLESHDVIPHPTVCSRCDTMLQECNISWLWMSPVALHTFPKATSQPSAKGPIMAGLALAFQFL